MKCFGAILCSFLLGFLLLGMCCEEQEYLVPTVSHAVFVLNVYDFPTLHHGRVCPILTPPSAMYDWGYHQAAIRAPGLVSGGHFYVTRNVTDIDLAHMVYPCYNGPCDYLLLTLTDPVDKHGHFFVRYVHANGGVSQQAKVEYGPYGVSYLGHHNNKTIIISKNNRLSFEIRLPKLRPHEVYYTPFVCEESDDNNYSFTLSSKLYSSILPRVVNSCQMSAFAPSSFSRPYRVYVGLHESVQSLNLTERTIKFVYGNGYNCTDGFASKKLTIAGL